MKKYNFVSFRLNIKKNITNHMKIPNYFISFDSKIKQ